MPGSEFKTCLPGGASTRFLPKKHYDVEMDYDSSKAIGNRLGTGAVIVFDHKTCLVGATLNLTRIFRPGVLRLVHSLPRGAAFHPRPALADRERGRERGVHSPC